MSQLIKIHRLQRAPHLQQLWFLCHLTLVTHLSHMVYGSTEDTNFNLQNRNGVKEENLFERFACHLFIRVNYFFSNSLQKMNWNGTKIKKI